MATNIKILQRVQQNAEYLDAPRNVTMRVTCMQDFSRNFTVNVTGSDDATERALRNFRQRMQ